MFHVLILLVILCLNVKILLLFYPCLTNINCIFKIPIKAHNKICWKLSLLLSRFALKSQIHGKTNLLPVFLKNTKSYIYFCKKLKDAYSYVIHSSQYPQGPKGFQRYRPWIHFTGQDDNEYNPVVKRSERTLIEAADFTGFVFLILPDSRLLDIKGNAVLWARRLRVSSNLRHNLKLNWSIEQVQKRLPLLRNRPFLPPERSRYLA